MFLLDISSIFLSQCASVLFDPRSTYSYVSTYFAFGFDMMYARIPMYIRVTTVLGESLVVD